MESPRACDRGSAMSRHRRTVRRASSGLLSLLSDIVAPPAHPISWHAICTEVNVRWKDLRRSDNVRDVRGAGGFGGGGRMGLALGRGGARGGGGGGGGCGWVFFFFRGSTEDVWGSLFEQSGQRYRAPQLTLFSGAVQSACGYASAASGPFYCPSDQRVYLDTSFFDELARMGGAGDFAAAYVIGHEVGHHVQTLLGTSDQVRSQQQRANETGANRLQVAMELQADCFAGVWAYHANQTVNVLEPGDVEEGLAAAQ